MSRLPFDPSKMAASRGTTPTSSTPEAAMLTVSQLGAMIDGVLKRGFPAAVEVEGEITGFNPKNHWYFQLKDGNAVVGCAMWQSVTSRVKFVPRNGQQVKVRGRIEFYAPSGKVTFIIDRMDPAGAGALEAQLRALVEECRALGWLDVERKRALPSFPRRVAIITSKTGAALQDVIDTVRRRCPAVALLLLDVRVQGDTAAAEVTRAIRTISRNAAEWGIDAVLVTRGGGSMEDLWGFNDREMARAIVECSVPVAAAIGHETDTTLAELVADARCATPTQAAMRLTPDREALERQLDSESRRLRTAVVRVFEHARKTNESLQIRLSGSVERAVLAEGSRVSKLASRLERCSPRAIHARMAGSVRALEHRLNSAMQSRLKDVDLPTKLRHLVSAMRIRIERSKDHVVSMGRQLQAVNPSSVLERGYSITQSSDGRVIRSASQCGPGTTLRTLLADGEIQSVVSGEPADAKTMARRKITKPSSDRSTGDGLFS